MTAGVNTDPANVNDSAGSVNADPPSVNVKIVEVDAAGKTTFVVVPPVQKVKASALGLSPEAVEALVRSRRAK